MAASRCSDAVVSFRSFPARNWMLFRVIIERQTSERRLVSKSPPHIFTRKRPNRTKPDLRHRDFLHSTIVMKYGTVSRSASGCARSDVHLSRIIYGSFVFIPHMQKIGISPVSLRISIVYFRIPLHRRGIPSSSSYSQQVCHTVPLFVKCDIIEKIVFIL